MPRRRRTKRARSWAEPRAGGSGLFERLERRELLTATPFSDAQKTAILAGFGNLKAFGDLIDTGADLATPVPGLGATIGEVVDVGGPLDDGVAAAVKAYFDGDPSGTVEELNAYLGALDRFKLGGSSTVTSTVDAASGDIEFTFAFSSTSATASRALAIDALDGV